MSIEFSESAIVSALEKKFGHGAPFQDEEYKDFSGPLLIEQANDLSELAQFSELTHLEIYTSKIVSLEFVQKLLKLKMLRIVCTDLNDISHIANHPALQDFDLIFTLVEDVEVLLSLPRLRRVHLKGNYLNEDNVQRVLPELEKYQPPEMTRLPLIDVGVGETPIAIKLRQNFPGFLLGEYLGGVYIVRPSIPRFSDVDCDAIKMEKGPGHISQYVTDIEELDVSSSEEMERFSAKYLSGKGQVVPLSDFKVRPPFANEEEALERLEASAIKEEAKNSLRKWILGFPDQFFRWYNEKEIKTIEEYGGIRIHDRDSFREILSTCAGFKKNGFVKFNHDSLYGDEYVLCFGLDTMDYQTLTLRGRNVLVVADDTIHSYSALVVSPTPSRGSTVYKVDLQYMSGPGVSNRIDRHMTRVYDSYADMLADVSQIKYLGGGPRIKRKKN